MKKMLKMVALLAIVAMPFTLSSCDDGPDWVPDDPYGWVNNYDNWHWNNGYDNQYDSNNDQLVAMAQTLCGEWYGTMDYSEKLSDGSRQNSSFYADMMFYQYNNASNSLSGNGTEIDYVYNADGTVADTQTLKFSWYIDAQTGNIYVKYASGSTFVMDANATTQYGFHLGYEQGKANDTFYGYMIGTNTDDLIYIDLERQNGNSLKSLTGDRMTHNTEWFGPAGNRNSVLTKGAQRLVRR